MTSTTKTAPPAPPRRVRIYLAIGAALLSGSKALLTTLVNAKPRDFDQLWYAAHALLRGRNPYLEIGPHLAFDWTPLYYPLTGVVAVLPFALFSKVVADVLFAALGAGAFVYAATAWSLAPAVVITSASAAMAAETVQWSPLLAASYGLPWVAIILAAKPTIGFAFFLARPSRIAVGGALGLLIVSFVMLPTWPADWLIALRGTSLMSRGGTPYLAPIATPGGVFSALAILRWRRPEARLLLALACVPQTTLLYETVPLFLIPASLVEGGVLWLGSWLVALCVFLREPFTAASPREITSAIAIGWLLYLPATVIVLRRPNVGPLSDRMERLLFKARLPLWVRGSPASRPTTLPSNAS